MKRVIVGTGYLFLSLLGTCLNLSALSVLPECEKSLTRPLLIFFSTQLFVGIGTLLSIAVPVPYMVATNLPYFINPHLEGAPGLLVVLTVLTSYLIQFSVSIYRNIRVVFRVAEVISTDIVVEVLTALAFVLAVYISVDITKVTNMRRFSVDHLSWEQTKEEHFRLRNVIAYSAIVGMMFYALSIFDLLYRHIYDEEKEESTSTSPKTLLLYQVLHLICDIVFCVLILLPGVERPSDSPTLAIVHSLFNIFGPAVWPTFSLIIYSERIRNELCFRAYLMAKACASQDNIQTARNGRSRPT
ncbi:unnamed protein product [Cylicocyclus nassatus]|uniref:Uncharacterized protein n=1 Tax=Cylicocyclus nassatus TaxID=53992 RepID=A0AA36GIK6_CYLNA|nr:unnamed protein product [Cylicocyclus nassatus]